MTTRLPTPAFDDAADWVGRYLGDLCDVPVDPSGRFRGGQRAADAALASFDVSGYAARRNQVSPRSARGASGLSPYIRHGLLSLSRVWRHVDGGPPRDVAKFRDELKWQEYARHVYARMGEATRSELRYRPSPEPHWNEEPWWERMSCVAAAVEELETDGWIPNQSRMWLASQWSIRAGQDWRVGEDAFFRHLLDGSRAANRLGWQWTIGAGTGRSYGFSRRQVENRAPGLCASCPLQTDCPIESWPENPELQPLPDRGTLRHDPDVESTAGPAQMERSGTAEAVWLTAESLGDADPALLANPALPVVFVFDRGLLARLELSGKRLVFMAEAIADLGSRREVEVHLGDPAVCLSGRPVAATFTPVPGWRRLRQRLDLVETHPWPWLLRPSGGSIASFSQWVARGSGEWGGGG